MANKCAISYYTVRRLSTGSVSPPNSIAAWFSKIYDYESLMRKSSSGSIDSVRQMAFQELAQGGRGRSVSMVAGNLHQAHVRAIKLTAPSQIILGKKH